MFLDIPLNNSDSKDEVADWIELHSIFEENEVSKTEANSAIEDWKGSEPDEFFINDVWLELERREFLYGEKPPFIVDSNVIVPKIKWEDNPEYLMCLLLSILGNPKESAATGKLFERLSSKAIRNYLGGRIVIYGYPSKQKVQDIAEELCEKYRSSPTKNFKDRGVDIIGWKPFGDRRPSQIVVLFQCAAGYNWKSKLQEVSSAWLRYLDWGCYPLKGFTLPQIIPKNDEEFMECSYDAGILIDRARIYRNTLYSDIDDDLKDQVKKWCRKKISSFDKTY